MHTHEGERDRDRDRDRRRGWYRVGRSLGFFELVRIDKLGKQKPFL